MILGSRERGGQASGCWAVLLTRVGLLIALAALFDGCGGGGNPPPVVPPPPPPPSVSITTTSLVNGIVGQAYSVTLQATGGTGARTWSVSSGTLPDGLSLDGSTGAITGTPTVKLTFPFTVQVQDSASPPQSATQNLSIQVFGILTVTTTSLPVALLNVPYSAQLSAIGGDGTLAWSLAGGSGPLPPGLTLSSGGVILGTPTSAGTFGFTAQVTDSGSPQQTASQALSLEVTDGPMILSTLLPGGVQGMPYTANLAAIGGTLPYTWSVMPMSPGDLPAGLILVASSGAISGTPTMPETQTFTVEVMDSSTPPKSDTQQLSIDILSTAGRNDTIGNATLLTTAGNRTISASISPFGDPPGISNPDTDFYRLTAPGGATVTVEITARRLATPSFLDSAIEIVDMSGTQFTTCRNEGPTDGLVPDDPPGTSVDPTPNAFDDPCVNDDIDPGVDLDSKLGFLVPGSPGTTVEFFVHVLDLRGDARPDFVYQLMITGAD
ncbi:MAG: Ig domain-containing protein [Terriglobia bacterium]